MARHLAPPNYPARRLQLAAGSTVFLTALCVAQVLLVR